MGMSLAGSSEHIVSGRTFSVGLHPYLLDTDLTISSGFVPRLVLAPRPLEISDARTCASGPGSLVNFTKVTATLGKVTPTLGKPFKRHSRTHR